MGDLALLVFVFAFGAGCGFYLRDWISKRRRERYQKLRKAKRARNTLKSSYLETRDRELKH
jgi:hypothetical protein